MTEPKEGGADRTEEQGSLAASEPKGAPPSGLTSEGAGNECPSEEGRRRIKAPGGERAEETAPRRRIENTALALQGITVERGRRTVVRDVSIEIPAGEVTALLGPNGAGKSSLVLAVGGVLRLQAGSVMLNGRDFAGRRPEQIRAAGIAIVPEGRRLLPDLTVEDNIRVATYALPRDQARAGRERVLELFPEIARRLSAPARMLSGGEQQMVVLAQALVCEPRYMLIDELSLGLAPVVVNRLVPRIRAVAGSGIGVLLIEQFATIALGLANQAHVMEGGRLRFSGLAIQLREQPELLRSAYLLRGSADSPGAS